MNKLDYQWITTDQQLDTLIAGADNQKVVFLDTEFIRRSTYWPIAALLQLRLAGSNYLVDPTSISNWQPLTRLLTDESVVKVIHACSEDIVVLWKLCGKFPRNCFDTQIAHGFLSEDHSIGYSKLVQHLLDVSLGQTASLQRSNWLRRPLSEKQCQYAIQDVEYLDQIYHNQQKRFEQKPEHQQWLKQACFNQIQQTKKTCIQDFSRTYLSIKGVRRISSTIKLQRLQRLAQWRELTARNRNIVKTYLVDDINLISLADSPPQKTSDWSRIQVGKRFDKDKDANDITSLLGDESINTNLIQPPGLLEKNRSELYKKLVAEKQKIAKELGIAHQYLASKGQLQEFILTQGKSSFGDWQESLLHGRLKAKLP